MPRKLRVPKQRRSVECQTQHRYQLLTGSDILGTAYGKGDAFDSATAWGHWREHREELLNYWCQSLAVWRQEHPQESFDNPEPGGPGTRPWAWWHFEAPAEPRHRIGGMGTPLPDSPLSCGRPVRYAGDYSIANPPTYEPERGYLDRHDLLDKNLDG